MGYFDVPRATTLVDIADELGQSDVDVSQQIRRGMGIVLRTTDVLSDPAVTADGGTDRSLDRMFDAL